jgi:hypothetical protein
MAGWLSPSGAFPLHVCLFINPKAIQFISNKNKCSSVQLNSFLFPSKLAAFLPMQFNVDTNLFGCQTPFNETSIRLGSMKYESNQNV